MAKQVVWSLRAKDEKKAILVYWRLRNRSDTYSKRLNQLFKDSIQIIKIFPRIGKPTNVQGLRMKKVKDYIIFYEETENEIFILTIWDGRQDPDTLENFLK